MLGLKRLLLFTVVVVVGGGLCITIFYTTLAAFTIEQLPFGREVAWMWMLGQLPATEIVLEDVLVPSGEYVGPGGLPQGLPVEGTITFGFHDPEYKRRIGRVHNGIDIAAPTGTPVFSTISGEVVIAGWNNQGYGRVVAIGNGNVKIVLAHNSKMLVKVGDHVEAGQQVAEVGSTGRSTAPHVHYEVRVNNVCVDPLALQGRAANPKRDRGCACRSIHQVANSRAESRQRR